MYNWYWRKLDEGIGKIEKVAFDKPLSEIEALRLIIDWNRQSAIFSNGRYHYWL